MKTPRHAPWHHPGLWVCCLALMLLLCAVSAEAGPRVRLGFFPNLTHAHALLLQSLVRQPATDLALPDIDLEWHAFNAGGTAMEAIFAKSVDMTYVGPSPVLNAFVRARGKGVRVLAAATRGGAGLVVRKGSGLARPEDFRGKRIATPQLGNTQDIACRNWLLDAGLKVSLTGGDVRVVPTANADQLAQFVAGRVDGVWTVEPWLSRLLLEGGGELAFLEPQEHALVAVLAGAEDFLASQPDLARQMLALHHAIDRWLHDHPGEARQRVAAELARLTRREFPPDILEAAWPRLKFDTAIAASEFATSLEAAIRAGMIRDDGHLGETITNIVTELP